MRLALLFALPVAFLSQLVLAIPSPTSPTEQQPFLAPASAERSRWRTLTGNIIHYLWQSKLEKATASARVANPDWETPAHIFPHSGGDVVLRFNLSTWEESKSLADAANTLLLDIWDFSHTWVDIRLSADIVAPLLGLLPASLQHSHTLLLGRHELAHAIYDTFPTSRQQRQTLSERATTNAHLQGISLNPTPGSSDRPERNIFFSRYQPLSVIEPWTRLLASLFTSHVRRISIGLSYQGRDIPALRVGVHPTNDEDDDPTQRKTVLVMGGLHAREWISTSTVNYLAYSLITGYGKTPSITRLLEEFDFVFIPTLNPDGYVYTWETDRLWRKNRQQTNLRFCRGIDLDRAFGFEWDGFSTTAGNPCSESFAGESPFEAVESKRLADWAKNETESNNVRFVGLLDLHSYSQEILYPYSYSCDETPRGRENIEELAIGLEKAIRVSHGHNYEVMPACAGNVAASGTTASATDEQKLWPRMEASGGSALDWFHHELGVQYTYQIKLRDRGTYGFLLPKEDIVPTGKEILDALLYLGSFLSELFGEDTASPSRRTSGGDQAGHTQTKASFETADDQSDEGWVVIDDLDAEAMQWELK